MLGSRRRDAFWYGGNGSLMVDELGVHKQAAAAVVL